MNVELLFKTKETPKDSWNIKRNLNMKKARELIKDEDITEAKVRWFDGWYWRYKKLKEREQGENNIK